MNNIVNLEQDLKSRYRALKNIQTFIEELKHLRKTGNKSVDELEDVAKYIEGLINSYKQMVVNINKQLP